jgi:hypothetical protein
LGSLPYLRLCEDKTLNFRKSGKVNPGYELRYKKERKKERKKEKSG